MECNVEAIKRTGQIGLLLSLIVGCRVPPAEFAAQGVWGDAVDLLGVSGAAPAPDDPALRPHIILILVDDLGWTGLSTGRTSMGNGSDYHHTPVIDALAAEGVAFTAAYQSPNCTPGRAALMSGQYSVRTKVYTNLSPNKGPAALRTLTAPQSRQQLLASVTTMAEVVQASGYRTGHFGKWHMGVEGSPRGPLGQGFDVNVGGTNAGRVHGGSLGHFAKDDGSFNGLPGLEANGVPNQFMADRLTDEAIDFLADDLSQPVFLYLAHFSVHEPIQAPEEDIEAFDGVPPGTNHTDVVYAAQMYNLDANVGRFVDWLQVTEDPRFPGDTLFDHSVIVLTSDNGGTGGFAAEGVEFHAEYTNNLPLRGGKGMNYEGAVRVPLIIYRPSAFLAGRVVDTLVQQVDLYPTIAEMADAPLDPDHILDGVSLAPLLAEIEEPLDREYVYLHYPVYNDYPEADTDQWRHTPSSTVHRDTWKLIYTYETEDWDLYDLATDLGETTDVSADHPSIVEDMGVALVDWLVATDADLPVYKGTSTVVPLPDPFAPLE